MPITQQDLYAEDALRLGFPDNWSEYVILKRVDADGYGVYRRLGRRRLALMETRPTYEECLSYLQDNLHTFPTWKDRL